MKSVRLGEELEGRLSRAAQRAGVPESQLIREGVERRCNEVLENTIYERIKDVIGKFEGRGEPIADRSDEAFAEHVVADHERQLRGLSKRDLRRS
jgi:predicted DNA-binding protein